MASFQNLSIFIRIELKGFKKIHVCMKSGLKINNYSNKDAVQILEKYLMEYFGMNLQVNSITARTTVQVQNS